VQEAQPGGGLARVGAGSRYLSALSDLPVQTLAPAEPRSRGDTGSRKVWPQENFPEPLGRKMGAKICRGREPAAYFCPESFCQLV
jgi:hypothetical protein